MRKDIGRIFQEVEPLVTRWAIMLAMAANDLSLCCNKINSNPPDYERHYYFRLAMSHLRECAKSIADYDRKEAISDFIKSLDGQTSELYKELQAVLKPYEDGSISKEVLKPLRDSTFHYPNAKGEHCKELVDDINALGELLVEFDENNDSILKTRYIFIDTLISHKFDKLIESQGAENTVNKLVIITEALLRFVDYILAHLKEHKERIR